MLFSVHYNIRVLCVGGATLTKVLRGSVQPNRAGCTCNYIMLAAAAAPRAHSHTQRGCEGVLRPQAVEGGWGSPRAF